MCPNIPSAPSFKLLCPIIYFQRAAVLTNDVDLSCTKLEISSQFDPGITFTNGNNDAVTKPCIFLSSLRHRELSEIFTDMASYGVNRVHFKMLCLPN